MQTSIQPLRLWHHPLLYLKRKIDEGRTAKDAVGSVSREKFFEEQVQLLSVVQSYLLMEGYDAPFMERESTVATLRELLSSKGKAPIYISAILSEGQHTVLDHLAHDSGQVRIVRTPDKLVGGYTLFDEWGISQWDSTKPSCFPFERMKTPEEGFYYRDYSLAFVGGRSDLEIRAYHRIFREYEERVRVNSR